MIILESGVFWLLLYEHLSISLVSPKDMDTILGHLVGAIQWTFNLEPMSILGMALLSFILMVLQRALCR